MIASIRRVRRRPSLSAKVLLAAAVLAGSASQTLATLVAELDFAELHRRAGHLFHARCLARREVFDGASVPYTEYVFEVLEAIKGCDAVRTKSDKTIVFRHAGTRSGYVRPDGLEVPPLRLGVPEYEAGEELVLFLTRESASGFCAPVGLSQGVFRVKRSGEAASIRAPVGARRLFRGTKPEAFQSLGSGAAAALRDQPDEIPLGDFLELCRRFKG